MARLMAALYCSPYEPIKISNKILDLQYNQRTVATIKLHKGIAYVTAIPTDDRASDYHLAYLKLLLALKNISIKEN